MTPELVLEGAAVDAAVLSPTPVAPTPVTPVAIAPEPQPYRLSVTQYHAMIRADILGSGDRVELIEGILVRKMPVNNPHIFATNYLFDFLVRLVPVGAFVNCQAPITTKDSEPEPDVSVVRGDRRQYLVQDRKPSPDDIEILIEVSDSSLAFDRTTKLQVYARAGVPQYWVVSIPDRRVEVHTSPTGLAATPAYQQRQDFVPGQDIPVTLAGREVGRIVVADLFL